jgi:nucleoside-diphosphate-sugar epimerase
VLFRSLSQSEDVINVVGNTRITIESLAKTLIEIHGNKNVNIRYTPTAAVNRNLIFDNTKLKEKLLNKFTPMIDGLQKEYFYMKEKLENEHFL